jgi:hypothetical protein
MGTGSPLGYKCTLAARLLAKGEAGDKLDQWDRVVMSFSGQSALS